MARNAMRFELVEPARAFIQLRASGLLGGLGHDPTLAARSEPFAIVMQQDEAEAEVEARFPVDAIEPPADMPRGDRDRMRENLRSPAVLDALRYPAIDLRGRYRGNREGGVLSGDLIVRGVPRPISVSVGVSRDGDRYVVAGCWEGKLTALGVQPFKALLGTLRLKDWIRLRFEAAFVEG
jgi:hypothetical protein